jgi:hypothetical protein
VVEVVKWGSPSFEHHGILGGVAAFKRHVGWGLWKAKLLKGPCGAVLGAASSIMGTGKPTGVDDLPADDVIVDLIKQVARLNEGVVKTPGRGSSVKRSAPRTPPDLAAALKANAKAAATFAKFSPSCKREYVEWIVDAKQDETRKRRLAQAIEWMAQGKSRNWKYQPQRRPKRVS